MFCCSADELAQKKKMVEQRLREKERRLSRLSQAISGNPNANKQTQNDINNMADKLRKMQALLERNEQVFNGTTSSYFIFNYRVKNLIFTFETAEKGRRS
jgi:lipid II:glycine glycyltransferase (peptidoglycan interpeptide bridge formation enzyme)